MRTMNVIHVYTVHTHDRYDFIYMYARASQITRKGRETERVERGEENTRGETQRERQGKTETDHMKLCGKNTTEFYFCFLKNNLEGNFFDMCSEYFVTCNIKKKRTCDNINAVVCFSYGNDFLSKLTWAKFLAYLMTGRKYCQDGYQC